MSMHVEKGLFDGFSGLIRYSGSLFGYSLRRLLIRVEWTYHVHRQPDAHFVLSPPFVRLISWFSVLTSIACRCILQCDVFIINYV